MRPRKEQEQACLAVETAGQGEERLRRQSAMAGATGALLGRQQNESRVCIKKGTGKRSQTEVQEECLAGFYSLHYVSKLMYGNSRSKFFDLPSRGLSLVGVVQRGLQEQSLYSLYKAWKTE